MSFVVHGAKWAFVRHNSHPEGVLAWHLVRHRAKSAVHFVQGLECSRTTNNKALVRHVVCFAKDTFEVIIERAFVDRAAGIDDDALIIARVSGESSGTCSTTVG